jgi:hypothetical protein
VGAGELHLLAATDALQSLTGGNLVETDDLIAWSSLYCRYRSLTGR